MVKQRRKPTTLASDVREALSGGTRAALPTDMREPDRRDNALQYGTCLFLKERASSDWPRSSTGGFEQTRLIVRAPGEPILEFLERASDRVDALAANGHTLAKVDYQIGTADGSAVAEARRKLLSACAKHAARQPLREIVLDARDAPPSRTQLMAWVEELWASEVAPLPTIRFLFESSVPPPPDPRSDRSLAKRLSKSTG